MARNKLVYLVVDTETATLPFADDVAHGDPDKKKKIAIARPLTYNIGYTKVTRSGEILERKDFLITEIFSVPSVFNTAYYAEKRPVYLEKLARGEITLVSWLEFRKIFLEDLRECNAVGAFNSMFDFKKAIPFTDLYIKHLYSPDYTSWEEIQRKLCVRIANEPYRKDTEKDFEGDIFRFCGEEFSLFDLWGLSTRHILNNSTYKKECLAHELLTNSGTFFKTSAESTYKYLCNKYDFEEAHTALEDAEIESFILSKIAERHAITPGIEFFPFRNLGETIDFCMRRKVPDISECIVVYKAIETYIEANPDTRYSAGLTNKLNRLAEYMGI